MDTGGISVWLACRTAGQDPASWRTRFDIGRATDLQGTYDLICLFDSIVDNRNPVGQVYYGASTLLRTPNSLSQEVGTALGAQAGEARLREVITGAGAYPQWRPSRGPWNGTERRTAERFTTMRRSPMSRTHPPARALRPCPRRRMGIVLTPLVGAAAIGVPLGQRPTREAPIVTGAAMTGAGGSDARPTWLSVPDGATSDRLAAARIAVAPRPVGAGR